MPPTKSNTSILSPHYNHVQPPKIAFGGLFFSLFPTTEYNPCMCTDKKYYDKCWETYAPLLNKIYIQVCFIIAISKYNPSRTWFLNCFMLHSPISMLYHSLRHLVFLRFRSKITNTIVNMWRCVSSWPTSPPYTYRAFVETTLEVYMSAFLHIPIDQ